MTHKQDVCMSTESPTRGLSMYNVNTLSVLLYLESAYLAKERDDKKKKEHMKRQNRGQKEKTDRRQETPRVIINVIIFLMETRNDRWSF